MDEPPGKPLIGVVGPCGSGKSTLIADLELHRYVCRHIAQEHSYVQDMWKRISHPDILIYLHASFPVSTARRNFTWQEKDYNEQIRRLQHAHAHADLIIDTDLLSPDETLEQVLNFLKILIER